MIQENTHEKNIPAEQEKTSKDLRIPQKNEECKWKSNYQQTPPRRPQETSCLSFSFPKEARILHRGHYQKILRTGTRLSGKYININYRYSEGSRPRLGITVSKKYGKAHERNRFKRVTREAFRQLAPRLPSNIEIHISPASPFTPIFKKTILEDLAKIHVE